MTDKFKPQEANFKPYPNKFKSQEQEQSQVFKKLKSSFETH